MKPNLPFIFTVFVGILGSLFYNLRGPDYSESPSGIPPWPIFKVATRVGEFFRSSHLASNPGGLLFLHHGISYTSATSLYVIAKLGVADVIKDKQIDYEEIALAVNVLPEKLYRVIRYLSSEGVFNLNGKLVSLTPEGQFLRSDREDSMRWCLIHMNEETAESMHNLLEEVKTGKEAFESKFGKNIFDLYEERPSSAEAFTKCMSGMFSGLINPPTTAEYDFSQHKVLLDFGGGRGYASFEILKQHDSVAKSKSQLNRAIVFDLDKVVTHANKTLHSAIEFKGGSFFDVPSIPKDEADVILINGVLHDWNDEECWTILRNAANALVDGGRIIVTDFSVPDPSSPFFNAISRLDVFMMTISSGFFRTLPEYQKLWSGANLRLVEVRPTRSINTLWILEK